MSKFIPVIDHRYVIEPRFPKGELLEVRIREVSPSGNLFCTAEDKDWAKCKDWLLVEELSIDSPEDIQDSDAAYERELKAAVEGALDLPPVESIQ